MLFFHLHSLMVNLIYCTVYDVLWCSIVLWRIDSVWTGYWFLMKWVCLCLWVLDSPSGARTTSCFALVPLTIASEGETYTKPNASHAYSMSEGGALWALGPSGSFKELKKKVFGSWLSGHSLSYTQGETEVRPTKPISLGGPGLSWRYVTIVCIYSFESNGQWGNP